MRKKKPKKPPRINNTITIYDQGDLRIFPDRFHAKDKVTIDVVDGCPLGTFVVECTVNKDKDDYTVSLSSSRKK